jgi:hypothetical protein
MKKLLPAYIFILPAALSCKPKPQQLIIIAGENDTNTLKQPFGMCADAKGNLYIADVGKNCITLLEINGKTSVYAGTGKEGNIDGDRKSFRHAGLYFRRPSENY